MIQIQNKLNKIMQKNALMITCLEITVKYGLAVFVLPIALRKLDSVEIAYFFLINTLVALAYLADGGFSPTIIRVTSYFRAGAKKIPLRIVELSINNLPSSSKPNWISIGKLVATTSKIYLIICLISSVILLTLGTIVAFNVITKQNNQFVAWLTYFLLIILCCLLLQVSRWSSLLQGLNEVGTAKIIELTTGVFRIISVTGLIIYGYGVLGVVIAMLASSLLTLILIRLSVVHILHANCTFKESEVYDADMLKSLWPSTWRMGVISCGGYLIYYASSLIVAQLPDANLIASYLLTFQVVSVLYRLASSPSLVYQPLIASAMSNGNLIQVNYLTYKMIRYSVLMYILGAIAIYFFAADLLILIKSRSVLLGGHALILMLGIYLLELHHVIHAGIYVSTNHIPFVMPAILSGILIIVIGHILVQYFSIYGVIISQLIVQASCNNWYPVLLSLKLQKLSFATYIRNVFRYKLIKESIM